MRKINPICHDGVMLVGCRLAQFDIDVDKKYRIMMPQRSPLTEFVIIQHHNKLDYAGTHYDNAFELSKVL